MFFTVVALASQLMLPAWSVDDKTDNNTGKRTVVAVQMSDNADSPGKEAGLWLGCTDGKPQLSLNWPQRIGTGFVVISVSRFAPASVYEIMPPTPWTVNPYSENRFAEIDGEPVRKLAKDAEGATALKLVVYSQDQKVDVVFPAEGFPQAFQRVAANCKPDQ